VPVVVPPLRAMAPAGGGGGGRPALLSGLTPAQQLGVAEAIAEAAQELAEEQDEELAEAEAEAELEAGVIEMDRGAEEAGLQLPAVLGAARAGGAKAGELGGAAAGAPMGAAVL
jgi:hypothetical protein